MMKMQHILLTLAVLAIVVFGAMQFMKMKKMKKEKFIMQLYRPTPVLSVPENTWDESDCSIDDDHRSDLATVEDKVPDAQFRRLEDLYDAMVEAFVASA